MYASRGVGSSRMISVRVIAGLGRVFRAPSIPRLLECAKVADTLPKPGSRCFGGAVASPASHELCMSVHDFAAQRRRLSPVRVRVGLLLRRGQIQNGREESSRSASCGNLVGVVEVREQLVELALRDRVVLVIVTARAPTSGREIAAPVVATRSTTASTRYCSKSMPPSKFSACCDGSRWRSTGRWSGSAAGRPRSAR